MADNELIILLKYEKQAAQTAAREYHASERKRIQETAREQAKAEKQALAERKATLKAIADEQKKAAKDAKELKAAESKAVRDAARESMRVAREIAAEERKQARESAAFKRDLERARANAERAFAAEQKKIAREQMVLAKEKAAAEKKAAQEASAAERERAQSVQGVTKALVGMGAGMTAIAAIKNAMSTLAESVASAREHIKGMVAEMSAAREASVEIAALTGNKATATFTAQQAREAAAIGITPEAYTQFQTSYQAFAGQYEAEKEGATPQDLAASGKKMTLEESRKLQSQVAAFSAARGIQGGEAAQLVGTLVGKSKPGATAEDIMGQFAKIFRVVERSKGFTGPLLGQLQEVVSESVGEGGDFSSALEASYLMRVMAERNPAEASTYSRALLRGLREIRMSPEKMKELGIDKQMNIMQQIDATMKAAAQYQAQGKGTESEFLSKYFKDIREFGSVKAAVGEGLRGGAFKRAMEEANQVGAGTAQADIAKYQAGEVGTQRRQESMTKAAERERAARYVALEAMKREAEQSVVSSGELEQGEGIIGGTLTKAGEAFGQGTRKEQLIRAETARMIRLGLQGYRAGREYLDRDGNEAALKQGRAVPESKLAEAANELKKIREITQKQEADRLRKANANVPPALPAAPQVQRR